MVDQLPQPATPAAWVQSVNIGRLEPNPAKGNVTGFGKRPVEGPVLLSEPRGPKGTSGVEGDNIGDRANHGGVDQAVYVFAREDLDRWEAELGRELANGAFGENLTTLGVDPNESFIGERWQVGDVALLQVTAPRIPCKTFSARMGMVRWARMFTESGRPGAYLRVLRAGPVSAGDRVKVVHRPGHGVTISMALFALTLRPDMLGDLLAAGPDLPEEMRRQIKERMG